MIRGAFLLIIGGFVVADLVSLENMRRVESDTRSFVADTVASIEQVARMARDVDQLRLLIDGHISERDGQRMATLEQQIAHVEADLGAAARAYEPIATNPAERIAWEVLRQEIEGVRESLARALELSRNNQDSEARAALDTLQSRFDAITRAVDSLNRINHDEAARLGDTIESQQQWATSVLLALSLACAVLAVLLAGWVTRILGRQDAEIRDAFSKLEQQNRELDAFAGRVAHDLRGPLTTINLSAGRLAEQLPREAGTFAVFERAVSRMERMIEDLLALSRVDAQATGMSSETAIVASAVEQDLGPATAKVGGVVHVDVEPATVRCSEGLLRQVLDNLGENAVKYRRMDVKLEIRIKGRVVGESYQLRVSDNGSGMSPEDARHAFEPFFRSERAQSLPGTGLGLTIVARIIHASGGTVSLDSQLERGSTFVIRLPLERKSVAPVDELFPVLHDPT